MLMRTGEIGRAEPQWAGLFMGVVVIVFSKWRPRRMTPFLLISCQNRGHRTNGREKGYI